MSTLEIDLYGVGWDLFAFPVATTRSVTETLAPIDGLFNTVYGYQGDDSENPWRIYDTSVPEYVNSLDDLEFGEGYWIYVLTDTVTLRIKGMSTSSLNSVAGMQRPPSTFYGIIISNTNFIPTSGMNVTATVDGKFCGQGETLNYEGEVVYVISIFADSTGQYSGCGSRNKQVKFQVGSQPMFTTGRWDNNQLQELQLARNQSIYLPIILR